MPKKHLKKHRLYKIGLIAVVVIFVLEVFLLIHHSSSSSKSPSETSAKTSTPSQSSAAPAFNKQQYSTDQASSPWVVVNKGRVLPSTYVPAGLVVPTVPLRLVASSLEMYVRSDTAAAMTEMFTAAKARGINLMLASGYRSYSNQVATYGGFVKTDGVAKADTYSARPGHSEHQTGLAADLEPTSRQCEVQQCFGDLPEGKWLAANAYKYGFIIRYRPGNEALTGYEAEPWHVRYVGKDLAAQIQSSGQTLEQFFGLPAYTSYPAQSYQLQ